MHACEKAVETFDDGNEPIVFLYFGEYSEDDV